MDNPYRILGITSLDTKESAHAKYKRLSRKYHPDLHPGDKECEEMFKRVSAAWDMVKDKLHSARDPIWMHLSLYNVIRR